MLPTRSTATVQPASVHQVMKRSRISLSASVRARRRRPPALPGPISPERMTVDQKRGASMVIASDADMAHALPARSGLTPARESLSTALTAADDRPICGAMADAVPAELRAKVLARIDDEQVVRLACDLIRIPSFTTEETPIAEWLAGYLREQGLPGTRPGTRPGRKQPNPPPPR